jgi:uncharacterized delta-60 repeat protein
MKTRLAMTIQGAIYCFFLAVGAAIALAAHAGGSAGKIDPSFGQSGEALVQPNPQCAKGCPESFGSHAEAVALLPDGSIVLAGNGTGAGTAVERTWLVRLDPDGALDPSFGAGGYAEGQPGLAVLRVFVAKDGAATVLVRSAASSSGLGLARFTPTGAVDTSYGEKGVRWLVSPGQSQAEGVFDAQGRIVVLRQDGQGDLVVARFLPSGEPDTRFGRHGAAVVGSLGNAQWLRLATEPSGTVIVAATARSRVLLARLMSTGATDRRFGRRGVIVVSGAFPGSLEALAAGPDHGILLASSTSRRGVRAQDELVVARYTRKGLDRSFGVGGLARTAFSSGHGSGLLLHAIAFESNGNAVFVGERRERSVDVRRGTWFIARYTQHGRDCAFGGHGTIEGMEGGANAVAIQSDQRIVIAGWGPGRLPDSAGTAFMAARYTGGGTTSTCPGEGRAH